MRGARRHAGWRAGWSSLLLAACLLPLAVMAQQPSDETAAAEVPAQTPETRAPEAGDVAVSTRVSPEPSRIGDLLRYEVTAVYPAGLTINLPIGVTLSGLEIVHVEEGPAAPTGDGYRKVFTFELQRFELGEATIPSFELTAVTPDGEVSTVQVPASKFFVESLTVNEAAPERRGEERPMSPDFPNEALEWILYGLLVGIMLGALIYWVFRRYFRRDDLAPVVPAIPPDQIAIEALDSLEERRLSMLERGASADYYLDLTDITKAYLEGRFEIAAMDRTTDEIRRLLLHDNTQLGPLSVPDVMEFFDRCDL
ncbi:MAG: hypothetical protein ACPHRO_02640, partial [Nannocystaceae bacterium]